MLVLMTFTLMVSAPIMCVGGIVLALGLDVPLSGVLLAVVPVLGISVGADRAADCGRCSGPCRSGWTP